MAIETAALAAAAPTMVLADTPYLAVSAGKQAGIPAIVVASFTWSDILRCFDDTSSKHQSIVGAIERSYADADMALRIAPGLSLSGVRKVVDIGPIAEPAQSQREQLRSSLGITESERLILVGFGGIPLQTLPWDQMERMEGYHFLVDGVERVSPRIHSLSSVPFSFKTALASVDVVMTKPGYGTIVEAVALGLPVDLRQAVQLCGRGSARQIPPCPWTRPGAEQRRFRFRKLATGPRSDYRHQDHYGACAHDRGGRRVQSLTEILSIAAIQAPEKLSENRKFITQILLAVLAVDAIVVADVR